MFVIDPDFPLVGLDFGLAQSGAQLLPAALRVNIGFNPLLDRIVEVLESHAAMTGGTASGSVTVPN